MNRLGILVYGAVVAGILLFTAREAIQPGIYLYENRSSDRVALGVAGWFVATFGPLILSVWFWRLAERVKSQWLWHLIFIPCAIAFYRAGAAILFYAAGVPDGDSVEGYTLIAGFGLLLFTSLVHAIALIVEAVTKAAVSKPEPVEKPE